MLTGDPCGSIAAVEVSRIQMSEKNGIGGDGGAGFLDSIAYHAVLAVKDERGDALAACGGLRSLTAARAVIPGMWAIPPKSISRNPIMNTHSSLAFGSQANVFSHNLSVEELRERVPAVFAESVHERLSQKYTFIPTERVLSGLLSAGFVPVDARQAHTRNSSLLHARHVIRMRRRFETVQLRDSVPEIVFLNSHDGTSAYQLRLGLFLVVCTNGLIVSRGGVSGVLRGAPRQRGRRRHCRSSRDVGTVRDARGPSRADGTAEPGPG